MLLTDSVIRLARCLSIWTVLTHSVSSARWAEHTDQYRCVIFLHNTGIKPGHIPQSVSIPFVNMLDLDNRSIKSPGELKEVFAAAGVDLTKPVVASCGSGTL